jgi:hypothetical protein
VTDTSDDALALASVMPVEAISPGAIRKPPPMPKKPAASPASRPTGASLSTIGGVKCTFGSPSLFFGISIEMAIAIMAKANHTSSVLPSTCLANSAPINDPARPAMPKVMAHGHLTRPARACAASPVAAFTATAAAEVPIAAWVSTTPTT